MARALAIGGAVVYALWGILHLEAARGVWQLAGTLDAGDIQGRLQQDAFYLAFFAVFAIVVAATLNWRNSRLGFWLNAIAVSAADIPFILFLVLPGHVGPPAAVLGPALWLTGLALTAMARLRAA